MKALTICCNEGKFFLAADSLTLTSSTVVMQQAKFLVEFILELTVSIIGLTHEFIELMAST